MEMLWMTAKKQVDSFVDGVKEQLGGVVLVVASIWAVYALDTLVYFVDFSQWFAIKPLKLSGIHGILTMPFVHVNLGHIVYNTLTLVVALLALAAIRPMTWFQVLVSIGVASGVLTWIFGGSAPIVGASGVVMGLVSFLVAPGAFLLAWWGYNRITKQSKPFPLQVQPIPLVVSALVGFFYLDNLFFNLVPIPGFTTGNHRSWSAHWCGAVAGLLVAFVFSRNDHVAATDGRMIVREETVS